MSSRLPVFEECHLSDDPKKVNEWVFVYLQLAGRVPFTPDQDNREWLSEHLVDLAVVYAPDLERLADENGMIHVSQLPQPIKKLRPPHRGQQHYLNNTSEWVPIDEPDIEPVMVPDMSIHTVHEQAVVAEQLRYNGIIRPHEEAGRDTASVTGSSQPVIDPDDVGGADPSFDPRNETVSAVNAYMRLASPRERRRIMSLEMTQSKPRQGILKSNRGV